MPLCWLNLLPSIIFRHKYFSDLSLLDAKLGNKPSYIWRSIHITLPLLKEGLLWKIGNGESVQIWRDHWLPITTFGKVQSPVSILPISYKVSNLIYKHTGWWNLELIKSIFVELEAQQILNTPLSNTSKPDKLIWNGTALGPFLVKSDYYLHRQFL